MSIPHHRRYYHTLNLQHDLASRPTSPAILMAQTGSSTSSVQAEAVRGAREEESLLHLRQMRLGAGRKGGREDRQGSGAARKLSVTLPRGSGRLSKSKGPEGHDRPGDPGAGAEVPRSAGGTGHRIRRDKDEVRTRTKTVETRSRSRQGEADWEEYAGEKLKEGHQMGTVVAGDGFADMSNMSGGFIYQCHVYRCGTVFSWRRARA